MCCLSYLVHFDNIALNVCGGQSSYLPVWWFFYSSVWMRALFGPLENSPFHFCTLVSFGLLTSSRTQILLKWQKMADYWSIKILLWPSRYASLTQVDVCLSSFSLKKYACFGQGLARVQMLEKSFLETSKTKPFWQIMSLNWHLLFSVVINAKMQVLEWTKSNTHSYELSLQF